MPIQIKEWFEEKIQKEAKKYNTWIDVAYLPEGEYNEHGTCIAIEDGFVTVFAEEKLAETEKAIQVKLSTGNIDGSKKGWKTWIPKSVVKM